MKLIRNICENNSQMLLKSDLIFEPEDYNMNENSSFLDIGSGFGKPNFHCALQVGCFSKGIEVVPARVEFCLDFYYEFLNEGNFFKDIDKNFMSVYLCKKKEKKVADFFYFFKLERLEL